VRCPICKSKEFGDYRGRPKARCSKCGNFERSRLLFIVLNALRLEGQSPIFHFAPEIGIGSKDFDLMFSDVFEGVRRIPLDRLTSKVDVAQFGIPERAFVSGNSHSIYIY
jgi:hypothetical protein